MASDLKVGDRVKVTDSNDHKIDIGTIIKAYPQFMHPNENDCYTIRLDKPWHGNPALEVMEIGRTSKTIKKIKARTNE